MRNTCKRFYNLSRGRVVYINTVSCRVSRFFFPLYLELPQYFARNRKSYQHIMYFYGFLMTLLYEIKKINFYFIEMFLLAYYYVLGIQNRIEYIIVYHLFIHKIQKIYIYKDKQIILTYKQIIVFFRHPTFPQRIFYTLQKENIRTPIYNCAGSTLSYSISRY